jgi:uncharacterized protein (DUF1778 family)
MTNRKIEVEKERDGGLLNIRADAEMRRLFRAAAKLSGFKSTTGALHHFMVKTINDMREKRAAEFEEMLIRLDKEDAARELKAKSRQPEIKARELTIEQMETLMDKKDKGKHVKQG